MSSTTFPNTVQEFKRWENLTSAQLTAYVNYINALNQGQWAQARRIFERGQLSDNMLPTADDFNKMCDTILECKALYEAPDTSAKGIQDFMAQFTYKGVWNIENISQYKKFNIVKYTSQNNGTYLYIANTDITTTQTPWDNSLNANMQWLRLIPVTSVNANSVFRNNWDAGQNYSAGDIVTYDNVFYKAISTNSNVPPITNNVVAPEWAMLFNMNPYIAQLSTTKPSGAAINAIWFKQL